ncbi:response regulator [bacterium]|nr:response regulator [bacterium]
MPKEEKVNILLVDDQPEELLALEASLASLDQNLILARSGEAALRFLLDGEAAVIVLDIQMTGMDGFEVAKALKQRKKTRRIPIIFMTGAYREERFAFRGYALGAVDYLTKPFEPEILRQKVTVFVDLALYEAELAAHVDELDAQKRLIEEVFANTPAGIVYLDASLVFLSANAVALDLLDKTREELIGRPASEAIADKPNLLEALRQVQARKEPYKLPELMDGCPREGSIPPCYEVLLHPVLEKEAALKGVLVFCTNVADRVARERLQLTQIETLQKVDTLKDEFLSVVSHELRTPLNAIMGFADILEDGLQGPLNPEQHGSVKKIVKGADQLVKLVNNLLDLSRVRAGQFKLSYDRADFAPAIEETVALLEEFASEKRITINTHLEGPLVVECDMRRMLQVLYNVLENAIKFSYEGGTVAISGKIEDAEMVIAVEDAGIGIAPENLSKIFERFTQVDMSTTREAGGTGLGLSIAKVLVEAHGGHIVARSPGLERGATICFSIPIEQVELPC